MVPEETPSGEGSREDTVKSQEGEKGGRGCEKEKPGRGREDEKGTRWAVRRVSVREGRGAGARGEGARLGPRGSCSEERQARAAGGPESQGRGQTLEEQERGQSVEGTGVFWKDGVQGGDRPG